MGVNVNTVRSSHSDAKCESTEATPKVLASIVEQQKKMGDFYERVENGSWSTEKDKMCTRHVKTPPTCKCSYTKGGECYEQKCKPGDDYNIRIPCKNIK